MKKKIIIYGLGNRFMKHREYIESIFEVVKYCDQNIEKKELVDTDKFIIPSELLNYDCDYILVTPENNSIRYFVEEQVLGKIPVIQFNMAMEMFYGQFMDDAILALLFSKIGIKEKDVRYLEMGVYDPIIINNTFYFYKKGASGILIDANPDVEEKVKKVRARDVFYNYAVAAEDEKEKMPFYIAENAGLSSLSPNIIEIHERAKRDGAVVKRVVEVDVLGINTILNQIPYDVDLVSIDIEGKDAEVLKAWDFSIQRPKVIIVELTDDITIMEMLKNKYILFSQTESNSIFVDEKYISAISR